MAMKESQYYGGSMQECKDAWECYRLREKALQNGFHVERRKKGVITIVIHESPDVSHISPDPHYRCMYCGKVLPNYYLTPAPAVIYCEECFVRLI
jgi:DNA-directed RNA polymerase subunit RPC12/RpoP